MNIKARHFILGLLFISYFAARLFFCLQTPYFDNDSSYFALRQIEHIAQTGKPLVNDSQSFGGRIFLFMPLYYYILAFFTLFFKEILIIKIINNLFAATVILTSYILCSRIIVNRKISLICALIPAFVPLYISETTNNISIFSIIIPLSMLLLYFFITLEKENNSLQYLIPLSMFLILLSSDTAIILIGMSFFLILSYLESIPPEKIKIEFYAFFMFFFLWANFLIYKSAFQQHGFSAIWGNTPAQIRETYFNNLNILSILFTLGLPFIIGIYTSYKYILVQKNKSVALFASLFLVTLAMFSGKLIKAESALIFLWSFLVILFAQFLEDFSLMIKKTKFSTHANLMYFLMLVLLILTLVIPSIKEISKPQEESKEYYEGFVWIRDNTEKAAVIIALPEEGEKVAYLANRTYILDENYLLIKEAEIRTNELNQVYSQNFKIDAIRVLDKYNSGYILFSPKAKLKYHINSISYINDPCFILVYNKTIEIYKKKSECVQRIL